MTAVARALHREDPPPWVLDDPLALPLAGDQGSELARQLRSNMKTDELGSFTRWVCVRARLTEDVVEQASRLGVNQFVILGAGLDSFAYRRHDLVDRLRIFEVDHPGSQEWKRHRLHELGIQRPNSLVYVPVDFERQTLRQGLASAGFDFAAQAVFSWIGVNVYLTLEAIRTTLATVASCAAGTQIVLTYDVPRAELSELGLRVQKALAGSASAVGEPFMTWFSESEIERLLHESGFVEVVHFGADEARRTYFPDRDDVRFGGAQRLAIARVAQAQ
jgi:methyltransferase (TIGR00027 family)